MNATVRKLELLAPAKDAPTAIAAIAHGADAVYIGAPAFGARAAAGNSIDELASVVDYAHKFGARVYVTFNTIIYNNEIEKATQLVRDLYNIGVDALIVQDMGILMMDIPPIELHASTQTDARTPEKIRMLSESGFSQIVVPREFSLGEIKAAAAIANPLGASIEAFVHGALCVSYSGDCHAGAVLTGRSANRGECPQICRLQYRLTDGAGNSIKSFPDGGNAVRHWLSLSDMNRLDMLYDMAEAGVTSFKIEGRLKSESYVKNVTAAYSKALDEIVAAGDGRYVRASYGKTKLNFIPDPSRSFNRGFTGYFINDSQESTSKISSWNSPKWTGRPIAAVLSLKGKALVVKAQEEIHNGDGLGYFDSQGRFVGFRVNKVDGNMLYPAPGAEAPSRVGVQLFRNSDTVRENLMARDDTSRRTIGLSMTLRTIHDGRIVLDITDERGNSVSVSSDESFTDRARSPQTEHRRSILERLGDTIYSLDTLEDSLADTFIPSKSLAALRRRGLECLESSWRMRFDRHFRRQSILAADALTGMVTSYHDNVANTLAEDFYRQHGAEINEKAIEVVPLSGTKRIMTTRYCLRRSLGACLKTAQGKRLPLDLYLEAPVGRLRLGFDCKNCNMQVFYDN